MKIAIIGAGPAGLCALKNCLDEGYGADVFEKSEFIGGTWNYNEETGINTFGIRSHTSTYEGLRTNIPKELMEFENFPFKKIQRSYIDHSDVLNYIKEYAHTFKLHKHIQFHTNVELISPLAHNRWKITIRNWKSIDQEIEIKEYDAVVICTGNFTKPLIPNFKGMDKFKGTVGHSFNYRKSNPYKNKKVLVIGSGPSGLDISRIISKVAEKVILSHRSPIQSSVKFPENIKLKPVVEEFYESSVSFQDGTEESITDLLLCTGYTPNYPFLSNECEIEVENNYTKYLYKQIINAKHPSMGFLGIPYVTFLFTLFGIQMRFLAYLKHQFRVSKEEMIQNAIDYRKIRIEQGLSLLKPFKQYYDDLSETAKIQNVPSVYHKLLFYVHNEGKEKFEECYTILNEDEFNIL